MCAACSTSRPLSSTRPPGRIAAANELRQIGEWPGQDVGHDRDRRARAPRVRARAGRRRARSGRDRRRRSIRHSPRATATVSASLSPPSTGRCHSLAMAMARMPLPLPTSIALTVSRGSSVASNLRQPRVVACVPVPKARPASMRSGSRPAGMPSATCEGWTQNGPTSKGRKERWFSATQSVSGSSSQCAPGASRSAASTLSLAPSPKISMRHGPSRETSRLVTTNPSSARCSSASSQGRRSIAGTTNDAFQLLTPPR